MPLGKSHHKRFKSLPQKHSFCVQTQARQFGKKCVSCNMIIAKTTIVNAYVICGIDKIIK